MMEVRRETLQRAFGAGGKGHITRPESPAPGGVSTANAASAGLGKTGGIAAAAGTGASGANGGGGGGGGGIMDISQVLKLESQIEELQTEIIDMQVKVCQIMLGCITHECHIPGVTHRVLYMQGFVAPAHCPHQPLARPPPNSMLMCACVLHSLSDLTCMPMSVFSCVKTKFLGHVATTCISNHLLHFSPCYTQVKDAKSKCVVCVCVCFAACDHQGSDVVPHALRRVPVSVYARGDRGQETCRRG